MNRSLLALGRVVATTAVVAAAAVGVPSVALADDWARDGATTQAATSLDPAIRTAIEARSSGAAPPTVAVLTSAGEGGFAWSAAALGLGVGVAAMCAVFACVTLVRHDGRLRNA
ncbi:MAG TPA: hypothetical protein VFJ60_12710 [Gaiella sp.]|nr:hypothetical protein [Gaiella sp.]